MQLFLCFTIPFIFTERTKKLSRFISVVQEQKDWREFDILSQGFNFEETFKKYFSRTFNFA